MTGFEEIREIAEDLSVLLVSSDAAVIDLFIDVLAGLFRKTAVANGAGEGRRKLRDGDPDVLVIDGARPTAGGLELLGEIRRTDPKQPVLLIVSRDDADTVFEAVSLGATQLVVKPLHVDRLIRGLDTALQRSVCERQKLLVDELTLTRQRERQRLLEERFSFFKELSTIRNDVYYRKLDVASAGGGTTEWFINIRYKPKDVLSGDTYSIRTVGDRRVFIFVIDAMSKGLSASFTAHMVCAFANYLIDRGRDGGFDFGLFLDEFQQFVRRNLQEEEPLSASFALLDLKRETMEYALFSMPPLYLQTAGGEVVRLAGDNIPIMKRARDVTLRRADLRECGKILMCSDGLLDPGYGEYLEEDFAASSFRNMLYNRFIDRVGEVRDDLTMVFLRRLACDVVWEQAFSIAALFDEVNRSILEIERLLAARAYGFEFVMECMNAFTEIVMNAYEHGSLRIGSVLKNRLIREGNYEAYLLEKERETNATISIAVKALEDGPNEILVLTVRDEGEGFDTTVFRETIRNPEFVDGRGLKMARSLVDELYFNEAGNEAILIKAADGRTRRAQ